MSTATGYHPETILQNAMRTRRNLSVKMSDGSVHEGCIAMLDGDFVRLAGVREVLLGIHQVVRIDQGSWPLVAVEDSEADRG